MSREGPLAFLDGQFVPQVEAVLGIHDAGLVYGATVTDFCRTFDQRLFRWSDHLARFRKGCRHCFIPLEFSDEELTACAQELIAHNARLAPPGSELALISFATPGPLGVYVGEPGRIGPATLVLHTFPLAFDRYRRFFTHGVALAVAGHHGSDSEDLAPPHVKHRSRLHWWRAEQVLRTRTDLPAGALALLRAGPNGPVTETAVGNLLLVRDGGIVSPPRGNVLEGISLGVCEELCCRLGIPFREAHSTLEEIREAQEVMLTGTAFCLAGVSWVEGTTIPWPGPVTRGLQRAWNEEVGLEVVEQILSIRG